MKHAIFNVVVMAVLAPFYMAMDYLKRKLKFNAVLGAGNT